METTAPNAKAKPPASRFASSPHQNSRAPSALLIYAPPNPSPDTARTKTPGMPRHSRPQKPPAARSKNRTKSPKPMSKESREYRRWWPQYKPIQKEPARFHALRSTAKFEAAPAASAD